MNENFREFLERLRQERELTDIKQAVDIRHIATLVDQSEQALYFHNVIGYKMPVVSGLFRTQRRATLSMGCGKFSEIEARLRHALDHPVSPRYVETAAHKEVIKVGDDVDLFQLPIPMSSIYDGGPMITAGVVMARDPEYGINSGVYRFLVKEKNLTGIDIVTPNNLRLFAQRALEAGRSLPISISIGTHPFEIMGAGFRAPLGVDEMGVAGGIRGAPVEFASCETIELPCVAGAEIVLEAEILPTGWTWPEGRFGEFTRLMGGLHWNPLVKVKAITHRRDAIYYSLHMPWENTWLGAPTRYTALRAALKNAGVQVRDINVTIGGCAMWHAVISVKKQAGEGKNALLAALSAMDMKHVVVVDDDIDVFNATDVEWAIATRVQGDRDVFVIPGTRAKPLDPSLPIVPYGTVPTGAKVGIDATIGEGIPRERYERISYAYADQVKIQDYVAGKADERPATLGASEDQISKLAQKIHALIENTPRYYSDIAEHFSDYDFQSITRALGQLHAQEKLWQDPRGRMCIRGSAFAARPPEKS
ncbi:MAG: UbiD family decarboxylase [Betaproteobacteria bacterium]|nr:UbiD family decarboxylase [Betaproteobacteria bacterium]